MDIFICIRSAAGRKDHIKKERFSYPDGIYTLRELLCSTVEINVREFNRRALDGELDKVLTEEDIEEGARSGRIGFGRDYSGRQQDLQAAQSNALQCFEDGLIAVFRNGSRLEDLDADTGLQDGDELVFVRLTFLAGRMW